MDSRHSPGEAWLSGNGTACCFRKTEPGLALLSQAFLWAGIPSPGPCYQPGNDKDKELWSPGFTSLSGDHRPVARELLPPEEWSLSIIEPACSDQSG